MKPIQTEQEIEANFLAKRAACIAAQEQIEIEKRMELERQQAIAQQQQSNQERNIRLLYNSYLESMRGAQQQVMPIQEWYSNYKSLVLNQCW